jgi:hypothetical protein
MVVKARPNVYSKNDKNGKNAAKNGQKRGQAIGGRNGTPLGVSRQKGHIRPAKRGTSDRAKRALFDRSKGAYI